MKRHRHRERQPGVIQFRRRSREGRRLADGLQCQPVEHELAARAGNFARDERALAVDAEADGDGAGSGCPAGAGGEDAVPELRAIGVGGTSAGFGSGRTIDGLLTGGEPCGAIGKGAGFFSGAGRVGARLGLSTGGAFDGGGGGAVFCGLGVIEIDTSAG